MVRACKSAIDTHARRRDRWSASSVPAERRVRCSTSKLGRTSTREATGVLSFGGRHVASRYCTPTSRAGAGLDHRDAATAVISNATERNRYFRGLCRRQDHRHRPLDRHRTRRQPQRGNILGCLSNGGACQQQADHPSRRVRHHHQCRIADRPAPQGSRAHRNERVPRSPIMDANTIVDLALELLDPADPMRSARRMVEVLFTDPDGRRLLHHHRGDFRQFRSNHYAYATTETIHSVVWSFLERSKQSGEGPGCSLQAEHRAGFQCDRCPGRSVPLGQRLDTPAWLSDADDYPPAIELTVSRERAVTLADGSCSTQRRHTSGCPRRMQCLSGCARAGALARIPKDLFDTDTESIETLQDWFGYTLSADTSHQKISARRGPEKRSGKGDYRPRTNCAARARQCRRPDTRRTANQFRACTAHRQATGNHFRRSTWRTRRSSHDRRAPAFNIGRGSHNDRPQARQRMVRTIADQIYDFPH